MIDKFIELFGTARAFSIALGHKNATTVYGWVNAGMIPTKYHQEVYDACVEAGFADQVSEWDFIVVRQLLKRRPK